MDNSAEDEKGSYDGTETNIEYRFGRFGQAAVFKLNGSTSVFDTNVSVPTNWTVSLWLKRTPNGYFGGTTNNLVRSGVYFYANSNGKLSIYNRNSSGGNIDTLNTSTGLVTEGNWHHIAITFDSTSGTGLTTVYVDSVNAGTLDGTPTHSTDFKFGRSGDYTADTFNGSIDQMRIFDSALTSSQVTELYNEKPEVDTSNFKAVLYEGNSGHNYISNVGFQPDFVWTKPRTNSGWHWLADSIVGGTLPMASNATNSSISRPNHIQSFDANGFTLGSDGTSNADGVPTVAWVWKGGGEAVNIGVNSITGSTPSRASSVSANTAAGFSIVSLDKPNTNTDTYGHGLSSIVEMIILKRTASPDDDWYVYHKDLGNSVRISLNSDAQKVTGTGVWASTTPTASLFTLQNQTGGAHIAYCFHSVAGYSKIGSYSGSNSPISIITGFRPAFLMVKRTNATSNWIIIDSARETGSGADALFPNSATYESSSWNTSFDSNGFTISSNEVWISVSGGEYIYMAFK